MELECYYVVKARTVFHNQETDEIEFRARIRKFENKNPIEARKKAFEFRNEFIYGLLTLALNFPEEKIGWNSQTKEIEKLSDREIRKLLNPLLEPQSDNSEYFRTEEYLKTKTILNKEDDTEEEIEWKPPNDTLAWYPQYNNGIWVIFVHNDKSDELENEDDIVIDKITKYEEPLPTPPNYLNLEIEYNLYKKYDFETEDFETTINFFDDEEYLEGYYENEEETEEEAEIRHIEESNKTFKCLKTPFDWTGFDKIFWWNDEIIDEPKIVKSELPLTIQEAFIKGESHFAEFKPGLVNWVHSERNIELENAIAICAFLNSKGGFLIIGVADKKRKVYGVKFPENSKDKFLREFTRIKAKYLPPYLAHSINGEFYEIENKEVFIVTVYPSDEPVFIKIKDDNNKLLRKEFYIRSDASSRHIYDIEEVVRYCKIRYFRKRD